MNRVKLLKIALLLSCLGCSNAPSKLEIKKQEQLKLLFAPSFIPCLDFNLKIEKDSGELTYYVLRPHNLLTHQPPKTIVYDSSTFKVGGEAYLKFVKTIRELDVKNYKSGEKEGETLLDGLHARFQYILPSSDTIKLDFQSSNRKDAKVAYQLIDGFFEFSEATFKDNKTRMDYIGELKRYFDYPLPINKKLKHN